jgi:hypothetical protein
MTENMLANNKKSMQMPKGATIIGKSKKDRYSNIGQRQNDMQRSAKYFPTKTENELRY